MKLGRILGGIAMQTDGSIDLQRSRWFSALPEALQEEVLRSSTRLKLRRGKHILRQGDPAAGIFGLVSGEAQIIGTTLAGCPESTLEAACRAVVWHGGAADHLARARGQFAVRTTELLPCLSAALRGFQHGE